MSIVQVLTESTFADPCEVISLAAVRRAYRARHGVTIPRTNAIVELVAAGVAVAPNHKGLTVVLGRSWKRPLHWIVRDGRAVRVPA